MINQVILRSNTLIQFEDLKDAVSEYKTVGHTSGKTEKLMLIYLVLCMLLPTI